MVRMRVGYAKSVEEEEEEDRRNRELTEKDIEDTQYTIKEYIIAGIKHIFTGGMIKRVFKWYDGLVGADRGIVQQFMVLFGTMTSVLLILSIDDILPRLLVAGYSIGVAITLFCKDSYREWRNERIKDDKELANAL